MILLSLFKAHKIIATAWMSGMALLAAAEVTSNRTLILIAILSNVTLLVVTGISAAVSIHNGRKLQAVTQLPAAIQKLEISLDGRLQQLMKAEKAVSLAEGVEQERGEERGRQDAAGAAVATAAAHPIPQVEVVQPPGKSVPVKHDKES